MLSWFKLWNFQKKLKVFKKAENSRYGNGNDKRLVNPAPIVLFCIFNLTTSSGKHLEEISHAHIVSSMYKLITNAKDTDDLSIGFDRDRRRRREELADNKNIKSKYHLRVLLKDVFGFPEHQEKGTCVLGNKRTLTRIKDYAIWKQSCGYCWC